MNARALLTDIFGWPAKAPETPLKREFPKEAYSYDSGIDKEAVAKIQQQANLVLETQEWTVIERLGDGVKR